MDKNAEKASFEDLTFLVCHLLLGSKLYFVQTGHTINVDITVKSHQILSNIKKWNSKVMMESI